jgi:VanZ family protein
VNPASDTGSRRLSPPALRAWLFVIVWLSLILVLSTDAFSASATASLLRPFLRWLLPDWSASSISYLHFAIRKTAHVSVYGVLSWLTFRALRLSQVAPLARHAGIALLLVLVVAASDEYRQSRSRYRTGALTDVVYDLAGGLVALGLAILWSRKLGPAPSTPRKS